ncbi:lipid-A-disaccharide synthase [Candidatus Omnitrophota bacterium]
MGQTKKHIILIAGESSGDLHAAELVKEITLLNSDISFSGLGGPKMAEQGVTLYHDLTQMAVVGFVEVIRHYKEIKKLFDLILNKIESTKPDAVILIDYPGFNLRLAKKIKELKINTKIIYYISPQVWAWKKKRVFTIQKLVDEMLVFFPFEKDFYARYGINVHCVGHPLVDIVRVRENKKDTLERHKLKDYCTTIGLLPGSRIKEVETLLPIMLRSAAILQKKHPMIQFLILKAPSIDPMLIKRLLHTTQLNAKIIEQNPYDCINACDACIVASGTATLETAILQKPMVIVYKTALLTWILAKFFIKIKCIGLVNIVAGKKIVDECVQFDANGKNIAHKIQKLIKDDEASNDVKSELKKVKSLLGEPGAAKRAAEITCQSI